MKKVLGSLLVLSLCSCSNWTHEQTPQPQMPDKMEMVQHCVSHSGVKMPPPPRAGHPPHKLTHKQKRVLDMCLKENGINPSDPVQ